MERPGHLPDFEAPPLREVALSLQFDTLGGFGFADIGLLWERFRGRFPRVEYHPPIPPAFEMFGLRRGGVGRSELRLNLGIAPLQPRTWFLDVSGNEIVQFQRDRFVRNWRKIESNNIYPRYELMRARFAEDIFVLQKYLQDRNLGRIMINQCELTYVNEITAPDDTDPSSKVFRGLRLATGRLGEAEDITFTAGFLMNDNAGEPVGRIIVHSAPSLDREGRSVIQLTIVGRGPPASPTIDAALSFMDLARDHIVCGFTELTTEEMHRVWKRKS